MSIRMYTSAHCPYCDTAKRVLAQYGVAWTEIRVDQDPKARETMMALTQRKTVPQIFIGERHVGGCDDLLALKASGELEACLAPYQNNNL